MQTAMTPWRQNVATLGISEQVLTRQCPQDDDYEDDCTGELFGYKTDTSDEESMCHAALRSHPGWYPGVVNPHLQAYANPPMCQNSSPSVPFMVQNTVQDSPSAPFLVQNTVQDVIRLVSGRSSDASVQYKWFQQWPNAQASNFESIATTDSPIPTDSTGSVVFDSLAHAKGAELTRTQRRRAERRRAEQRRRIEATRDFFEEDDMDTAMFEQRSRSVTTSTCPDATAKDGTEITRTQRRRLQRRRAEQRLNMEMQQAPVEDMVESDPMILHISACIANQNGEFQNLGRGQQRQRLERRELFRKAKQRQPEMQPQNHEIYENANLPMSETSMPLMNAISDASSTCARSSCSTPGSFVDVSSSPSEPDETHEEEDDAQFSISDLMKWRPTLSKSEQSEIRLNACHVMDCLISVPESPQHSSDREATSLTPSATSWAARQEMRRNRFHDSSDEEIVRKMKSILNKLTVEKFPTLSNQLVHCGIQTTAHLEVLVREIFAKATTQHHFINMYADLCSMLHAQFSDPNVNHDSNLNMKRVLLNACQASFENHLSHLAPSQTLDSEEESQMYKLQMIGNIKFVGALLLRKMLASKVMYYIIEELLTQPYLPEALECFVAFLTVVGPGFDHPRHEGLSEIFDRAKAFSNDPRVKPRIRWLLKDVLDLRACGWQDSKPKQREGPSTLEEVAQKFHAEAQTKNSSQSEWWAPQDSADNDKQGKRQTNVSDDSFDKALMHKELASTFGELLVSGDVRKAIWRIASINVPAEVQAEQTCDLLQFMAEMNIESIRTLGFKFIVTIFTERYWMPSAFEEGFRNFAGLCLDGKVKAPELEKVIHDEMIPAFRPAVNRGMLSTFTIQDLLHRLARM